MHTKTQLHRAGSYGVTLPLGPITLEKKIDIPGTVSLPE